MKKQKATLKERFYQWFHKTPGEWVRFGILSVAIIALCVSIVWLVLIFTEYRKGDQEYDELQNYITEVQDEGEEPTQDEGSEEAQEQKKYTADPTTEYHRVDVDFDGLKAINPDVVAWIQFETVKISYPVVQGTDDEYYLKHTFKGQENSAGSIFMAASSKSDFSYMNTIIFGHNMKNASMFGWLGRYKSESFYAGHEYFWIYTPEADYRYQICSVHETLAEGDALFWSDKPCQEYTDYVQKIMSASKYNTGVSMAEDDKMVTLATCTSKGKQYRLFVHGKLIETISHVQEETQEEETVTYTGKMVDNGIQIESVEQTETTETTEN